MPKISTALRTHTCGDLTKKDIGKKVKLCGWCHARRDHGGIIFIDLRDRYGITQLVFLPEKPFFKDADKLRREDVIDITGIVKKRPKGMENPKLKTGEIEVFVESLTLLNKSRVPPFEIDDRIDVNEDVRLRYRYLDLRRPRMQNNLQIRYELTRTIRDYMNKQGFIEVETPFLTKSTPEGARDYLVPSRVHPGRFYALPQSPQLFKQILMVAGFDRYFQIVKCFRDEDLRADRQPEFTQLDIEMSFIDKEDIFKLCEGLMKEIMEKILKKKIKIPFPRISYQEAMEKYGTDAPDLRFGLELHDIDSLAKKTNFEIFKKAEVVKCIFLNKELTRKETDDMIKFAISLGAEGLAWARVANGIFEGSIVKFIPADVQKEIIKQLKIKENGTLFFLADRRKIVNEILGKIRVELAKRYGLIDEDDYKFCWVIDFPLLEYSEEEQRYVSVHHPFTMPYLEDLDYLDSEPEKVRSHGYDLVLNGVEIGGGSIRIHNKEIQKKVFKALEISDEEAKLKFGFLQDALSYGAPPHGGIAFGLDRLAALLTKNESIREVIAFPKNKAAQDLMCGAPSDVNPEQLKELNIKLDLPKKEK